MTCFSSTNSIRLSWVGITGLNNIMLILKIGRWHWKCTFWNKPCINAIISIIYHEQANTSLDVACVCISTHERVLDLFQLSQKLTFELVKSISVDDYKEARL